MISSPSGGLIKKKRTSFPIITAFVGIPSGIWQVFVKTSIHQMKGNYDLTIIPSNQRSQMIRFILTMK